MQTSYRGTTHGHDAPYKGPGSSHRIVEPFPSVQAARRWRRHSFRFNFFPFGFFSRTILPSSTRLLSLQPFRFSPPTSLFLCLALLSTVFPLPRFFFTRRTTLGRVQIMLAIMLSNGCSILIFNCEGYMLVVDVS